MVDGTEFFLLAVAGLTAYGLGLFDFLKKDPATACAKKGGEWEPSTGLCVLRLPGWEGGGGCPDPYALVRAQRLDCIGRNGRWDDATLTCQPGPSLDPCAFLTGKAKIRCQESGIVPLPPSLPTADLVPLSVFVPPPSEPVPIYTPPPPGGGGGGPIKPF